jgi:DNA-binding FrmR family transcriptional regulator
MDKDKLVVQLHRIEGQVRGIALMVETDRGLVPTMQQLMAARSSLNKVMRQYVGLFLADAEQGSVTLTQDQVAYILKLIES